MVANGLEVTAVLSEDNKQILATFLRQYQKLADTELGKAGLHVAWDIAFGPSGGSGRITRPTDGQIIELLVRFRPFWAQTEPARFRAVHDILYLHGELDDEERECITAAMASWKDAAKHSPYKISEYRPEDWVRMFFNADFFHPGQPHEQVELDDLLAAVGDDFGKMVLLDAVTEYVRALIALASVAYRIHLRVAAS